jgi:hypothetical protein
MNCRIKTLFVILFFLVGCQGYDDQEPIQRTAAQGVVVMDEDELEGISDEELFMGQVTAGGVTEDISSTSWSASGLLYTADTSNAVQLQVDFPKSGAYTLQFSLEIPDGTDGHVIAIAEIDWKVEGNWVHRVVNIRSGTAISGTSEACKVVIRDLSTATPIPGQVYRVSVQIATGTRGATSQPPIYQPNTTVYSMGAGDLGPFKIPVPQNSGIVSVWMAAYVNAVAPSKPVSGTVIGILYAPGAPIGVVDLTNPQWVPIPPGTDEIWVYNTSGVAIKFPCPIFGIEG